MRLFAFAALLALPLLGLGTQSASADYYCCGQGRGEQELQYFYVHTNSVVFDCDAYYCKTKIKVYGGTKFKAECRNGWCNIKDYPFADMWVLESCLKQIGGIDEGRDEGEDVGDVGEGWEARHAYHRSHRGY